MNLSTYLLSLLFLSVYSPQEGEYQHLIGTKAKAWEVETWINSEPVLLEDLQGKVVLIRWWTGPYCPYCINSSTALNLWHEKYYDKGFRVIGMYHHKSRRPFDQDFVEALADKMQFAFPIGIDSGWKNLKKWWLEPVPDAGFTSVSFLLDQKGEIVYIHPGGEYVKGDGVYEELEGKIQKLLKK